MGVTSYPTLVTTVSDDIDKVGGKNATLGMIREDHQGKKYILLKAAGTIDDKKLVIHNVGPKEATGVASPFIGANTTGKQIGTANGLYFWCQNYGPALLDTDGAVALWNQVSATTGGVCTTRVSVNEFFAGFALENDNASNQALIFIDPSGSFHVGGAA